MASRRERAVEGVAVRLFGQETGFQHGLGEFLDEQRHPVGLGDDLVEHFVGQGFAAGDARHHGRRLGAPEPG